MIFHRVEPGRRQFGETHHEHGANGKVRRHDAVGVARFEKGLHLGHRFRGQPGRTYDSVDTVAGAPSGIGGCRAGHGEIHGHLYPGLGHGFPVVRYDHPSRVELLLVLNGVHRRNERQVGVGGHGRTNRGAHPATGAEDPYTGHAGAGRTGPSSHSGKASSSNGPSTTRLRRAAEDTLGYPAHVLRRDGRNLRVELRQ